MKRLIVTTALYAAVTFPLLAQGLGPGYGPGYGPGQGSAPVVVPATPEEVQWMQFMREEEKLARDVYRFLYLKWNLAVFDKIAASEQQHFTAIGNLITRYKIDDPAATDTPGVFVDSRFAKLYADLTAKGALSLKDALEVGVLIEQTDIDDLSRAIVETRKWDLKRVFNNLTVASFSHLDAFETHLEILDVLQ